MLKKEILCFFSLIILPGCTGSDKKVTTFIESDSTLPAKEQSFDPYTTTSLSKMDTTTLKGKREYILKQFQSESPYNGNDTLFDLNYDSQDDYIIRYYGMSGTGFKNRAKVYLYNAELNQYIYNEQLSSLTNPTFYIKRRMITSFYLPYGTGSGSKLEWVGGKWVVTKEFIVDNQEDKSIWVITYPLKNRKEEIRKPYQMIPPEDILETDIEE